MMLVNVLFYCKTIKYEDNCTSKDTDEDIPPYLLSGGEQLQVTRYYMPWWWWLSC